MMAEVFQEYCLAQIILIAEGVVDTPKQQVPIGQSGVCREKKTVYQYTTPRAQFRLQQLFMVYEVHVLT